MDKLAAFEAYRAKRSQETLLGLLGAHERAIYNVCRQVLRHDQDAEDAAQKALLEVLDGVRGIRDGGHFTRWVYRVAYHAALKAKRARMRRLEHEQKRAAIDPPAALPEETVEALHEQLAALDDDLRSVVVDHYFERRSLESLAAEKGCSTVAVWKKLQRAKESLRKSLIGVGLAGVVPHAEKFLESIVPVEAPPGLITPAVAAKAAAVAGGSAWGPLLVIGGALVKTNILVAIALLGLAVLVGYGISRQRESRRGLDEPVARTESAQSAERPIPATTTAPAPMEPVTPKVAEEHPTQALDARTAMERLITALRHGSLAEIRKAQQDLLASLLPEPVPDEENAAVVYRKAFASLIDPTPDQQAAMQALSDGVALTPEQKDLLKAYLENNRDALTLAREAATRPRCNFGIDFSAGFNTPLSHIAPLIQIIRLLDAEAIVAADSPASMEIARVAGRAAEALADEPCLISQLVRCYGHNTATHMSELALEGSTDVTALRQLMESTSTEGIQRGFERAMAGEIYSATQYLTSGNAEGSALGLPVRPFAPGDPLTAKDVSYVADVLTEFMGLIDRPLFETRESIARLDQATKDTPPSNGELSRVFLPSTLKVAEGKARMEAAEGALRIGAAARLYRLQYGSYPASLDELRCVMPEIPVDPCSGRPFNYRQEGSGCLIYSVGPDGVDNGGTTGVSENADLTFRVGVPLAPR